VELLVIPFRVEEVHGAAAGADHRALMVAALSFQKLQRLVELFRSYLEGLVGDTILLKTVAVQGTRPLKKHDIGLAALEAYEPRPGLAAPCGYLHPQKLGVKAFRAVKIVYRNTDMVDPYRLDHNVHLPSRFP